MKIKWSGIGMVDGRGKINGSVASKNRSGAYVRTKVTPVNRRTNAQQNVRSKFGFVAQLWRNLSELQRNMWNSAVSNYQQTDVFGDLKSLSGFGLFSKLNLPMINTTGGWNVAPPTPVEVPVVLLGAFAVNTQTNVVSLAISANALNTGGGVLVVDATPPMSPGINFVKSEYRRIHYQVVPDSTQSLALSLYDQYVAVFGTPIDDMKIFIRAYYIAPTGQTGVPSSTSTIVTNVVD